VTDVPAETPGAPLPLTGERTAPGIPGERYWFHRHEAAYVWAVRHALLPGDVVIEAGAGEGYGAELMRVSGAARVIAVDYDHAAVGHMRATYPHLDVVEANLIDLPLDDSSADLVVSMQVIEHLWDVPTFLTECHRVLKPGGRMIVSTPNRLIFSPGLGRKAKPLNPFHVEEFDTEQVLALLSGANFERITAHGLHHAQRIAAFEATAGPLVPRLVRLDVHDMATWPPDVADLVYSASAADFDITDGTVTAHDLIVSATRK
jgi:2-polyprenyl-3-methyl-5-hydroxy-6-metoxy-1,4-benzoquinol methylase